jgi:predicted nucleic acid-binding protein
MRFLLDVSVLVAHGLRHHTFHHRVESWLESIQDASLLTCSITELGFVRILSTPAVAGLRVDQARELLLAVKESPRPAFIFLPDPNSISMLPGWVRTPKQVTDGHLLELARVNEAQLATLDARIPGAFLVP